MQTLALRHGATGGADINVDAVAALEHAQACLNSGATTIKDWMDCDDTDTDTITEQDVDDLGVEFAAKIGLNQQLIDDDGDDEEDDLAAAYDAAADAVAAQKEEVRERHESNKPVTRQQLLRAVQLLEVLGTLQPSDHLRARIAKVRREVICPTGAASKRKQATLFAIFKRQKNKAVPSAAAVDVVVEEDELEDDELEEDELDEEVSD